MNIIYGINSKHLALIIACGIGTGLSPCTSYADEFNDADAAKIATCKAGVRAALVTEQKECFKEAAKDTGGHVDCFPPKSTIDSRLKKCEGEEKECKTCK
jgi:hypothetical protein